MGPPPPAPPQGLCFGAPWPWGMGEQSIPELKTWWLDRMEGGGGLRFFLQFDPGKVDRTLLGVSLSALFSRLLGWTRNGERRGAMAIAEAGGESATAAAAVSAAALAAAVSVCFAAMHASGQRTRRARRPPLSAAVLAGSSSARPRALPSPDDGLRIVSSKEDESLENVIHGTSIGAGDDEPVIVARVVTTPPDVASANADDETERGQSEAEEKRQEAERLRELWLSLVEREQILELRLQELEGLREQEATVRELENSVAAAATEARLLQLRVASLQEENGRLRAQLEELDDARAQLARAREKLREIKARVEEEQEEARREEAALRAKVEEMERGEEERALALAAEAAALREANAALEEENMELALRLQDAEQAAASSVHLVLQEEMADEAKQLRETNERLTQEIERLRIDHCAHVEELVYLKWVNACLRHELSDDGSALTGAMDLSKSMSFRSSERARQLMLRYGHPGLDGGGFDPALFSPLHESMDGGKRARNYAFAEQSPAATSTAAATAPGKKSTGSRNKLKFLGNFKKLLPGGGGSKKSHSSHARGGDRESRNAPPPSDEYLEKAMQWLSAHDVLDVDRSYETTPLSSCDRTPPSSVTTATPRRSERVPAAPHGEPALARSRSDAGASYGREASRYHSLRPDHPHPAADETGAAPEVREPRRRSEELRTRGGAARACGQGTC